MSLAIGIPAQFAQLGSPLVPAIYVNNNILYRRIQVQDSSYVPIVYMPLCTDYMRYIHFYVSCASTANVSICMSRTDQYDNLEYICIERGQCAIFVSNGIEWAYIGMLYIH
jgi:hypothetical protein